MNDYHKSCKPKNSTEYVLSSYHNLIDNLRNYGCNLSNYMTTTLDKSQNQLHEEFFFKSDLARLRFFFFFGRCNTELKHCKIEICMLYNDSNFKSSAHISDTPHETLILAEMILNNSSLQLIDNGKHTDTCLDVVTEISKKLLRITIQYFNRAV